MGYRVSVIYQTPLGPKPSIFYQPNKRKAMAWLLKADGNANIVEVEVHDEYGKMLGRVRGDAAPF